MLVKETTKSYKLKLLNEKELKEHFQIYSIWLFHYYMCHSPIQYMRSIWLFQGFISILLE